MPSLYRRCGRTLDGHGRIAQLGEHGPYKAGVAGSSPAPPTTKLKGDVGAMASGDDEWFADEQVEKILRLAGVGGGTVLDLCCGPGRHAVALAKRGFAVTAVDRTPFLLDQARARAAHASLPVEFVLEDMRRFSRPATFDLIINFFTSFGYFDDQADDLRVLELVRENLRPGGVFVLEMVSKEGLARAFQATTSRELPNGHVLFQRHEIVDDWSGIRNRWTLIGPGSTRTFAFTHRIYSGQEMKDLLTKAGLRDARAYGDLDGSSYGFDAQRLVAVARRSV